MKSTHWIAAAALTVAATIVSGPGCKKEASSGQNQGTTAPAPAEGTVSPAAAESAGGGGERAAADVEARAEAQVAAEGTAEPEQAPVKGASDTSKDVVAIGSAGKTRVASAKPKTLADTDTYSISLAAPAQLAVDADGSATLVIVPKPGWKLNQEFPTKLTVAAPAGVSVAKGEQKVADAVQFTEKSGTWAVKFRASQAGDKSFTGKVKFAVCTETTCDPKKEELAWNVAVK